MLSPDCRVLNYHQYHGILMLNFVQRGGERAAGEGACSEERAGQEREGGEEAGQEQSPGRGGCR